MMCVVILILGGDGKVFNLGGNRKVERGKKLQGCKEGHWKRMSYHVVVELPDLFFSCREEAVILCSLCSG